MTPYLYPRKQQWSPKKKSPLKHQVQYGKTKLFLTDEGLEHYTVVQWLRLHNICHHHSPNESKRHGKERLVLHALGCQSGFPDLLIFQVPISDYPKAGYAIEMKFGKNKLTKNQKNMLKKLESCGWITKVFYTAKEAINWLEEIYGKGE